MTASIAAGYRQVDHTADLALELWGPNEEELLRVAARAIVEILTDSAVTVAVDDAASAVDRPIHIDAVDAEDRLVQWLNEVIVAAVVDGFLIADADIELGPGSLVARARGRADQHDRVVTELKSATYHDLRLETGPDGARAHVVIDV